MWNHIFANIVSKRRLYLGYLLGEIYVFKNVLATKCKPSRWVFLVLYDPATVNNAELNDTESELESSAESDASFFEINKYISFFFCFIASVYVFILWLPIPKNYWFQNIYFSTIVFKIKIYIVFKKHWKILYKLRI